MLKSLVITNHPLETWGNLEGIAVKAGYAVREIVDSQDRQRMAKHPTGDLMVVMGGPQSANDPSMEYVVDLAREHIEKGLPYLGICLGAQVANVARGGKVIPGEKQVGNYAIDITEKGKSGLMQGLGNRINAFQWHGEYMTDIPQGAEVLATTSNGIQAFAKENVLALQFHLELTQSMLYSWLCDKEMRAYATEAGSKPDYLMADFLNNRESYKRTLQTICTNFLEAKNE